MRTLATHIMVTGGSVYNGEEPVEHPAGCGDDRYAAGLGAQVDIVGAPRCMARVLEITGRGSLLSQHALDDVLADPVKSS